MNTHTSNIVLIGMPGVGKSTLGVVLAKRMNYQFTDADLLIQAAHNATLQTLIDREGAEGFIAIENAILREINLSGHVIATGGSAVYSTEGMKHLAQNGLLVYLKLPYNELSARLGDLDERGVVMRGACTSLQDVFDERSPLYEHHADISIDVSSCSIPEAVKLIEQTLNVQSSA